MFRHIFNISKSNPEEHKILTKELSPILDSNFYKGLLTQWPIFSHHGLAINLNNYLKFQVKKLTRDEFEMIVIFTQPLFLSKYKTSLHEF